MFDKIIKSVTIMSLHFLYSDSDSVVNKRCPRCAWSDRTKYSERKVNLWAQDEPSNSEVG